MATPQHIITRTYDNLKGFSTDNIYARPPEVADDAINIHKNTDESFGPRRGFQCEVANIGGLGLTSLDTSCRCGIQKICLDRSGNLYRELNRHIFLEYELLNFLLGWGFAPWSTTPWSVSTSSIASSVWFEFTIFTDPRGQGALIGWSNAQWSLSPWGAPGGESITFNGWLKNSGKVNGNQTAVNTINLFIGHIIVTGQTISLLDHTDNTIQYRVVTGFTATSITFSGAPVTVEDTQRIDLFFEQLFLRGFDVNVPYPISQFITYLNTIPGISAFADGIDSYPAAFIPIVEPTQLTNSQQFVLNYFYWEIIPHPVNPLLPGSANSLNQNSPLFENASFAIFDEVLYCTNGFDFPVKYDGQNSYRAGVPIGNKVNVTDAVNGPFQNPDVYNYGITYEQKDKATHVVEGQLSPLFSYTVPTNNHSNDVTIDDIVSNSRYNTDGAIATTDTATVYGPDNEGFYYHELTVLAGYTFIVGDVAYYRDDQIAKVTGAPAGTTTRLPVLAGHGVIEDDIIYFTDATGVLRRRTVVDIDNSGVNPILEIDGVAVDVSNDPDIYSYIEGQVFGHIAISTLNITDLNVFPVLAGHTLVAGDEIQFTNPDNIQVFRTITSTTPTSITFLHASSILAGELISSSSMSATEIFIQAKKLNPIVTSAGEFLSNNLRINIYRTLKNATELRLVSKIPNNSFNANQVYNDKLPDSELGPRYIIPLRTPAPPPMAKYLLTFENLLIYAGGSRNPDDTDFSLDGAYFSQGDDPENVPIRNSFLVPSNDDVVSGVGSSGSTLALFKDRSIYAITGELLTDQFKVEAVAPGSNIGCAANATICSQGGLLYFMHTNGVYTMSESQLFPTDPLGKPIPLSQPIDVLFREKPFDINRRFVFKRAVAINYTQDNEYWLFLPCENVGGTIRNANANSRVLCFDYEDKNWFEWTEINAAGGLIQFNETVYWQERRLSGFVGNTSNLYRQHNARRLVDYADHTKAIPVFWASSWEDVGYPEVRKKFIRCMLLIDRIESLYQFNQPALNFASYVNRYSNLKDTISLVTTVNNSTQFGSAWSWTKWAGLVDSFVSINLKQGTVAKSLQISLELNQLNTSFKLSGFQLEISPEYTKSFLR